MRILEKTDETVCTLCGKPRDLCHASTFGVAGTLLGCNTYYLCSSCAARGDYRVEKSTLSPCNDKHIQTLKK